MMVHALGEAKTGRRGTNDQLSWKASCFVILQLILTDDVCMHNINQEYCDCQCCSFNGNHVTVTYAGCHQLLCFWCVQAGIYRIQILLQSLAEQKGLAYENAVGGGGQCNHSIHINFSATPTAVLQSRDHICGDHAVNVFTDSSFHCYLCCREYQFSISDFSYNSF